MKELIKRFSQRIKKQWKNWRFLETNSNSVLLAKILLWLTVWTTIVFLLGISHD